MFDPVNEPSFRLDVAGLPDAFEVLAFTGTDAISEPFVFDVDLLIYDPALDLASLLYRPVFLQFDFAGSGVHGQLHQLVQREHGTTSRFCRVRVGPKLACLAQRFSQRIFSARSVPQILNQVLQEHGIVDSERRFELGGDYPLREFCTQYRESDLQFFQRLCAEEQLHYYFEHRRGGHCLVIGDDQANHAEGRVLPGDNAFQRVSRLEVQRCTPSTGQGRRAMQGARGRTELAILRSGQLLSLFKDDSLWVLTDVEHHGDPDAPAPYSNKIRMSPWTASFADTQAVAKPRMPSLQRAWVVEVDESPPDPSRPVAVQFDWLYQGEGATPCHCWLPLAAQLQGPGMAPLRDGAQVVVSFIDGDPDQPLISGLLRGHAGADVCELPEAQPVQESHAGEALLALLQASEPLVLLCLLPGGGSFSHCRQAICTCRAAVLSGQSGAA
ncbi:contractile injection system protein, VgrG/Pvc8 family [Pseudomonas sp. N3-W]|uniref:contractile injection system protein, VgrG/Pvc8 family n=1 Tax=Pseudomonas sp. N3-W TaxID=2975049 RepID=UPI00217E7D2E|nr:contractile injection system protein, VgrG/Pvc8 family [Pseudomonas sp. N3-W]UWF50012.1 contractile injection system protein, VgrG/Pvc8 family [Pseudomonas sp. N3-W]